MRTPTVSAILSTERSGSYPLGTEETPQRVSQRIYTKGKNLDPAVPCGKCHDMEACQRLGDYGHSPCRAVCHLYLGMGESCVGIMQASTASLSGLQLAVLVPGLSCGRLHAPRPPPGAGCERGAGRTDRTWIWQGSLEQLMSSCR